ncbi:hypothetical protein WR25_24737 [Diploscapter pachys]|uniref:Uncharacterized protein n=1 Tax=Diploscapter pachys TaxID=2018661 RepID=A0A2A2L1V3_9BILA|nr:hypothetical protein WR25_24737 [Diploscapter pachys]
MLSLWLSGKFHRIQRLQHSTVLQLCFGLPNEQRDCNANIPCPIQCDVCQAPPPPTPPPCNVCNPPPPPPTTPPPCNICNPIPICSSCNYAYARQRRIKRQNAVKQLMNEHNNNNSTQNMTISAIDLRTR